MSRTPAAALALLAVVGLAACTSNPSSAPSAAPSSPGSSESAAATTPSAPVESLPGAAPMPTVSGTAAAGPTTKVADGWLIGQDWRLKVPQGWNEHATLPGVDAALYRGESEDVLYGDAPTQVTTSDPKSFRDAFNGTVLPDLTIGGEKAYGVQMVQDGKNHRVYAFAHKGRLHVLALAVSGDLAQHEDAWKQAVETYAFTR